MLWTLKSNRAYAHAAADGCLALNFAPAMLPGDMKQVGWVVAGDVVGESALVNSSDRRLVTVVAGDGGCHVAVLERATYYKLQNQQQEDGCKVSTRSSCLQLQACMAPQEDCLRSIKLVACYERCGCIWRSSAPKEPQKSY